MFEAGFADESGTRGNSPGKGREVGRAWGVGGSRSGGQAERFRHFVSGTEKNGWFVVTCPADLLLTPPGQPPHPRWWPQALGSLCREGLRCLEAGGRNF